MKLIRQIALGALLTIGAFSAVTYTSCSSSKDKCKDVNCQNGGTCTSSTGACACPTGTSGTLCDTLVRNYYTGDYKGSGSDNSGGTYTNWNLAFTPGSSSDITAMNLSVLDENLASQLAFTVHLTSNTTYTLDAKTSGNFSYTGSGTISATSATLTINETTTGGGSTTVYTFTSMIRQ